MLSSIVFCQDHHLDDTDKYYNITTLVVFYNNSFQEDEDSSLFYQQKYFYAFPNTFYKLVSAFGYQEDSSGLKMGPLYNNAKDYIDLFFQIDSITSKEYFEKLISISMHGNWQAPSTASLQLVVTNIAV